MEEEFGVYYDKTTHRLLPVSRALQPPEPLFHFDEQAADVVLQVNSIHVEPLTHINHIESRVPAGQGGSIHDPIRAKKLSKWFVSRAGKEVLLRQAEVYNLGGAGSGVGVGSGTSSSSAAAEIPFSADVEDKFSEHIVYDSKAAADIGCVSEDSDDTRPASEESVRQKTARVSLKFDSNFECGNLSKASRVYGRNSFVTQRSLDLMKDGAVPCEVNHEYDLTLQNDTNTSGNIQWYYFRATAVAGEIESFPMTVRFNITNMQKSDALYNYGMKPLVYSDSSATDENIGWTHGGFDICYYKNGRTEVRKCENSKKKKKLLQKFSLSFSYTFPGPDTVYFAHSYPYTYTTLQLYLNKLSNQESITALFRRRLLCKTLCGNRCDLLTITGPADDSAESRSRKVIVISARIHPGETNSSFAMQGIIDFLLSDACEAEILRKLFVFKLIPMLNPDGVVHGNYRCSLAGTDLNRRYTDAHRALHPEVTSLRELLKETVEDRGVFMYLDLHGHSRNKNAFFYGCDYYLQPEKAIVNSGIIDRSASKIFPRIFPKLVSTISNSENGGYFSFKDCSFKIQKSKLGTGRVVSWGSLGIEGSYTVELSFCGNGNNAEARILKKAFSNDRNVSVSDRVFLSDSRSSSPRVLLASVVAAARTCASKISCDDSHDASRDTMDTLTAEEGFADDERESESCDRTESGKDLQELLESYRTAKHFTQSDFRAMGRDLCVAMMHYVNVRSMMQLKLAADGKSAAVEEEAVAARGGHELLEQMVDQRIAVLHEFDSVTPLCSPCVFSPEAINSAVTASRTATRCSPSKPNATNREDGVGAEQQPRYGYRIHTEIALRTMLGLASSLDGNEGLPQTAYIEEAENDAGSDSDPSCDNLPIDTVLRQGNLGANALSLFGFGRKPRKKVKKQSRVKIVAIPEVSAKDVSEQPRRNLPPRVPLESRRRRDESMREDVLSTGSIQRFVPTCKIEDLIQQTVSQVKVQSIVFKPEGEVPSGTRGRLLGPIMHMSLRNISEAEADANLALTSVNRRSMPEHSRGARQSLHTLAAAVDAQNQLQAFSNRYRMRNVQVRRQGANAVFPDVGLATCRKVSALSETIRDELDSLALGMRSTSASPRIAKW